MITAIIPLRLSKDPLYDELARLDRICSTIPDTNFLVLIVDFGTAPKKQKELIELADRYKHARIVRTGDPSMPFSIGEARDYGVQCSNTPVVMFHDLDFLCETETYHAIAAEAGLRKLDKCGYDYLCVPTIYLTKKGSDRYLSKHNRNNRRDADRFAHDQALRSNKNDLMEHFAIGSSATLLNRYLYLMSGGHDRSFVGHGAEDFEFYNRLSDIAIRAGRPPEYHVNHNFAVGEWKGFRAFFALYGMDLWMRGIALVHLHHPRREAVDPSYANSSKNFDILREKLSTHSRENSRLPPMYDPDIKASTLVLVDPKTMPGRALLGALPALGFYRMLGEQLFRNPDLLIRYVEDEGFDHVLFLNPYGNSHRLNLYESLRARNIKCFAFDRGALPDSWFFDDAGFLGNSANYDPFHWDQPLTPQSLEKIEKWIKKFAAGEVTLEPNGKRKSAKFWHDKLNIQQRKTIFVALQRPADTATRFFAGPAGSYDNYLEWIRELAQSIDPRYYALIIKKHPLEKDSPEIEGAKFVPDDAHIHDLVELADKVVTLNSGVGVIALAMSKPVIVCGNTYYSRGGMAHQATSPSSLLSLVTKKIEPADEKAKRFLSYLLNKFYSFGISRYFEKIEENGSIRKICNEINFSVIRGLPGGTVELGEVPRWIPPSCFLFRGAKSFIEPKTLGGSTQAVAPVAKPEPTLPGKVAALGQTREDMVKVHKEKQATTDELPPARQKSFAKTANPDPSPENKKSLDVATVKAAKIKPPTLPVTADEAAEKDTKKATIIKDSERNQAWERELVGHLLLGESCVRRNDEVIEIPAGFVGHGVYGPYLPLQQGSYSASALVGIKRDEINKTGALKLISTGGAIVFDVATDGGNKIVAERRVPLALLGYSATRLALEFRVDPGDEASLFELRIWSNGRKNLVIHSAILQRS